MKGRKERKDERTKGKDEWKNERKGWMKERKERMNEGTKGKDEWKDERKGWMKERKERMNERTKGKEGWKDERKWWMKGRNERMNKWTKGKDEWKDERKEWMNEWMIERNFILLTVRIQHLISHLVLKESVHGYWEGTKIKKFILTRRLMELFSGVQVFSHGDSEVQV